MNKSPKAWYGKAYYFVEVPRHYMVSLWGITAFWFIFPSDLGGRAAVIAIAVGCLAYDIFVTSRAPDLRITKEEIQAKLAEGGRLYFLTVRELAWRLAGIVAGAAAIAAITYYWYLQDRQPVFFSRVATATVVLLVVAYLTPLGTPLRTRRELPPSSRPFLFTLMPQESKPALILMFGPLSYGSTVGIILLGLFIWALADAKIDTLHTFLRFIFPEVGGYFIYATCLLVMPLAVLERKLAFIKRSTQPPKGEAP